MLIYVDARAVCPHGSSIHRSLFKSVIVDLNACLELFLCGLLALAQLIWLGRVFSQVLVVLLWFVWLSISLCGFWFGLFASMCGFYVYVSVLNVYVCLGILLVEAGSCLQSGSQQSPDF